MGILFVRQRDREAYVRRIDLARRPRSLGHDTSTYRDEVLMSAIRPVGRPSADQNRATRYEWWLRQLEGEAPGPDGLARARSVRELAGLLGHPKSAVHRGIQAARLAREAIRRAETFHRGEARPRSSARHSA